MKCKITLLIATVAAGTLVGCVHGKDINFDLNLKVLVCNEVNAPIENADVQVGFTKSYMRDKSTQVKGKSDSNGVFEASAVGSGSIGVLVKKAGYYESWIGGNFFINSEGQLSPYDPLQRPIKILMRRKLNPIPMYAKKVSTRIPKTGIEYGFDLEAGDWVAPLGKGRVADLIFKVDGYWKSRRDNDATMEVSFTNIDDGFIPFVTDSSYGSKMKSANHAPTSGYERSRSWKRSRKENDDPYSGDTIEMTYNKDHNYYIRTRTQRDEQGNLVKAHYGKLYGDINYGGASEDGTWIKFTYYFNPNNNDTNVEFDPDKNLLKKLKYDEEVRNP